MTPGEAQLARGMDDDERLAFMLEVLGLTMPPARVYRGSFSKRGPGGIDLIGECNRTKGEIGP